MRNMLACILALGLATGGCAWFGGDTDQKDVPPAQPQEQTAAPAPAPDASAPTKAGKKVDAKATKAEKSAKTAKAKGGKSAPKSEAQIAAELDMVGKRLAAQAARTVVPSKAEKQVRQQGKEYVASYVDVYTGNVSTELRPGAKGQYVGFVRYHENVFECRGKSRKEALTASCDQVKSRRLNELIRYDGSSWQY